jgi:hypothetical protein
MQFLILVNLLTFAWLNFYQESYIGTEKKEFPEVPKGVKTIRLLSESEPIMDVAVHAQDQSESDGICYTIGPFKDHEAAEGAVADMASLGRDGTIRIVNQKVKRGYWVYFESRPGQDVEHLIKTLRGNGIKDYHKNARNELSLGIYNGIQSAKRRQQSIAELGYSPLVGQLYRNQTLYWIDVAELKQNMLTNETWDSYMAKYPDSERKSLGCDLVNA